jgi:hypothetical protein
MVHKEKKNKLVSSQMAAKMGETAPPLQYHARHFSLLQ